MHIIASAQYRGLNICIRHWEDARDAYTVDIYGPCDDYGDYTWSQRTGWTTNRGMKTGISRMCDIPEGMDEGPAVLLWLNSDFFKTMELKDFLVATLGPDRK